MPVRPRVDRVFGHLQRKLDRVIFSSRHSALFVAGQAMVPAGESLKTNVIELDRLLRAVMHVDPNRQVLSGRDHAQ